MNERLLTDYEMREAYSAVLGDRTWSPREFIAIASAQDAKTTAYWEAQLAKLLALMAPPAHMSIGASPQ